MSNDIDADDEDALFIGYRTEIKLIRIVENMMIPSRLKIRADVNPLDEASESDLSNIMSKIKFWFENLVTNCVAFSVKNDDARSILINEEGRNQTSNILMILPGDPTDDMLAAVIQSKLNALAGDQVEFGLIEVISDNPAGLSFTFVGSARRILPTMEEWVGLPNYFDKPWWDRDDASTLDITPQPDADLSTKPAWAFSLDTIKPTYNDPVIIKPFNPTVINGGKNEDE